MAMSTETADIEQLVQELQALPPEDRIRLIGRLADTLLPLSSAKPHRPLIYGEFNGLRLSCEEDFREAEWPPQEQDLDGS
jgi:hypothetical protein